MLPHVTCKVLGWMFAPMTPTPEVQLCQPLHLDETCGPRRVQGALTECTASSRDLLLRIGGLWGGAITVL